MAHINRRFIDKHWGVFIVRGIIAVIFGCLTLFGGLENFTSVVSLVSIMLLIMGIADAVGALYNSTKKRGWFNSVVDALVDVVAALALMFSAQGDILASVIILAAYTFASVVIDLVHGFLSTVDPTDRFVRVLMGIIGCVIGLVLLNTGGFEIMTYVRFFGVYMLLVGVTSMIYGVHNRSQKIEDKIARKEARKNLPKKTTKKR
jgi:uncharacterized membrane protein HdeD (DUF308 family)